MHADEGERFENCAAKSTLTEKKTNMTLLITV